jgi:hypothetical protein
MLLRPSGSPLEKPRDCAPGWSASGSGRRGGEGGEGKLPEAVDIKFLA